MWRSLVRNFVFVMLALALIGASLLGVRLLTVRADGEQSLSLAAQAVPRLQQAQLLQSAAANQPLHLSIGLRLRDTAAADALLQAINDPQSALYHHYLTPSQFTARFAPTAQQVQRVVGYLRNQGLTVTAVASNNLLIDAAGSVAQVQQSFHVQINSYRLNSRIFYANATAPSLPQSVQPLIASIGGLDNSASYHPHYQARPLSPAMPADPAGLRPQDLAQAYDLAPLQNAGFQGQNQTVALFALDGYQQDDIAQYFQSYHLPMPHLTNVLVDDASGAAGQGALETTLDIEMLGAMAPQSNILVYEGPATTQGINDIYAQIVNERRAQVVSISWGLCESSTGNAELQTLNALFKQGALEGISFLAAAGDAGAYDCQDHNLAVDSPAADPNVTAVGATSLQLNNGAYGNESVWSNTSDALHGPLGAGSGGGISALFKQAAWQSGPGVLSKYSNGNRELPDVAAFGDPATGYSIYCTVKNAGCPASGWLKSGGSSVAAPFWAASLLILNQYLQSNNSGPLGLANPTLYKLFSTTQPYAPFHDITQGSNLYYQATPGYDLASGIGSPDVYNIARDLDPSAAPVMTPPPVAVHPAALIQNGDFENGVSPWQEASQAGYELVDQSNPHSGQNEIFMCGYNNCDDRLWQTFTVPAHYTSLTLTYWWYASTSETGNQCIDTFASQLQTSSGSSLRVLQQSCNTNATGTWVRQIFDLSHDLAAYKGQSVTLQFHATNAQVQNSAFFIDDVSIAVV